MIFSVVIPTCNRTDLLINCLDYIFVNETQDVKYSYELLVCDDSANNTAQPLINQHYPKAKWISGPKRGPAANRNEGAKNAKGDWLIFIDDDCLPSKKIIEEYYNAITENPSIKVFEGCIKADKDKRSFLEEAPINENGGCLWSCNFCIEKEFFLEKLQGFDENFPFAAMEDVDLNYRVKKLNEPVFFAKNAYVVHPWREQTELLNLTKKRFESWKYFMNKHPENFRSDDILSVRSFARFIYKEVLSHLFEYRFRGIYLFIRNYLRKTYLQLKYSLERK